VVVNGNVSDADAFEVIRCGTRSSSFHSFWRLPVVYSSSGQTNGPFAGKSAAEPRHPWRVSVGSVADAGSAPRGTK
jgi:hypothetical protein